MYLLDLTEGATVVNTAIAIGCAQGLVKHYDSNLLECDGGPIQNPGQNHCFNEWSLLKGGLVVREKYSAENFQIRKEQFLFEFKVIIEMEDIPTDLVINWDQSSIHYVPVSNYTMEKEGSKRIELVGIEDKRQITAVFSGTMSGVCLPMQLIYQGKTQNVFLQYNSHQIGMQHLLITIGRMKPQCLGTRRKFYFLTLFQQGKSLA